MAFILARLPKILIHIFTTTHEIYQKKACALDNYDGEVLNNLYLKFSYTRFGLILDIVITTDFVSSLVYLN